ncbi:uncharacterized protein UHOR_03914 [Ustilago hordei]|uniref:Zn(2)-C6 fungal-type domain-containing protein n=1 Tax=Ustilago hordei TaxID=120017 RepID=I2FSP6_USTHO|nr:uncharacterized protein UHOR_03914 [Ustilago hordei]
MDRPPYYADLGGSAPPPRSSAPRGEENPRRGMDRLPPVLPSSHSLPKLPMARSNELPPLAHTRLPPIKDSNTSHYASHRPYPSMSDRPAYDYVRRPSSPSSVPVGMVSVDYIHTRRSPGESGPPSYYDSHMRHPDSYRHEPMTGHASSHMPHHHIHYDVPPTHIRHFSEVEPVTTATPIKRPRVSLACLACRNRKSRCDGVRPTCKTCANMKIECKWPEVDFRRAKTGDAAKARKRSPVGASSQRSPESVEQKPLDLAEHAVADVYGRSAGERGPVSGLPPSQSMPHVAMSSSSLPHSSAMASSPIMGRANRYRTNSDGDRHARHAESAMPASRSPSERHLHPHYAHESRSETYGRPESHGRPYSSAGVPSSRHDSSPSWMRDDRAEPHPQDRRLAREAQQSRPMRSMPESRGPRINATATYCKKRALEIAVLGRPPTDAQRIAVEAYMSQEDTLEDLAERSTAGERLDRAFAADWDIVGGLSHAARRPFMDVAAGIVGMVELFAADAQHSPNRSPADAVAQLHIFRLRNSPPTQPDLRHMSIAMDLARHEEREMLESASSEYDSLSYPIPVDQLSLPLINSIQRRALAREKAKADKNSKPNQVAPSNWSPVHSSSLPPAAVIPFVRQQDVMPPKPLLELFFQVYVNAVGEQMPGLDTEAIGSRIQDGSISALLANALCAIGASFYERDGLRPPSADALSSKVYSERARALIGGALQNPHLEAILALGVMAIRDILMGQMVSAAAITSSAVRLCMQLDLHRARPAQHRQPSPAFEAAPHSAPESEHGGRAQKLIADDVFWMTYCLDRITSIATARPLIIKDHDIDTIFPATMRKGEPCIFAALVRQLHYLGRLAEVALSTNGGAAVGGGSGAERERARETEIAAIGADLVSQYESLPSVLQLGSANLRRAHEKGESISFLQLHLTHNMALLHRFLLSEAPMTNTEYDAMRSAARETGEICMLGEAVDSNMLADTPLSAVACFLAACTSLAEIEVLQEATQSASTAQLESARSNFDKLMDTLVRHSQFWPVARNFVQVLETQMARGAAEATISPAIVTAVVSQVQAIHILVRRPGEASERQREAASETPVQVRKVNDLGALRGIFPHLC